MIHLESFTTPNGPIPNWSTEYSWTSVQLFFEKSLDKKQLGVEIQHPQP